MAERDDFRAEEISEGFTLGLKISIPVALTIAVVILSVEVVESAVLKWSLALIPGTALILFSIITDRHKKKKNTSKK